MDTGHCYMGRISTARLNNLFMNIPMFGQIRVTTPAVCSYNRAWLYCFTYKWYQVIGRYIRDSFHSYSAVSFRVMDFKGNNYDFFAFGTSASFSWFFLATNAGFINFNIAMKKVAPWSDHRTPQFMQPGPSRLITAQAKGSFDAKSTCSRFLTRNQPDCEKPCS
jgi:hypothetical protein